jgi:hypothetical protein
MGLSGSAIVAEYPQYTLKLNRIRYCRVIFANRQTEWKRDLVIAKLRQKLPLIKSVWRRTILESCHFKGKEKLGSSGAVDPT